ncbi:Na+/H+ antiporter NhaA [Dactylosporangium sp. CA-139066]|uniref:Na+/H+ antiporter NhaA n=1 Tax=Dactylosporangium sp. CA-139066 TaxID=3239930 RepID=UPI003D8E4CBD
MPGNAGRPSGALPAAGRIAELLRTETVGGLLLLAAAAAGLIWANSPWSAAYRRLADSHVGPGVWHLRLTVAEWAADGLLAIFFFVAGLELKRELVAGDLRDRRHALMPVAAAVGGMAAPAVLYVAVNARAPAGDLRGWAVPTATDIAFALAVLAVAGSGLPTALRTFLLTLAVVDDLLAITVIAVYYTAALAPLPLLLSLVPLAAFAWLLRHSRRFLGALTAAAAAAVWLLVHASGVHATVAGVLLAATVPVHRHEPGGEAVADRLEHRWRPVSAGFAVPVFAFFAAGVPLAGAGSLGAAARDPVTAGVVAGLVAGKPLGVLAAVWLVRRATGAPLPAGLGWWGVVIVGLLSGIGFTVALLIAELAFGAGTPADDHARLAVLAGSCVSAAAASALLWLRRPRRA